MQTTSPRLQHFLSSLDANESAEHGDICNQVKIPLLSHQEGSEN